METKEVKEIKETKDVKKKEEVTKLFTKVTVFKVPNAELRRDVYICEYRGKKLEEDSQENLVKKIQAIVGPNHEVHVEVSIK